MNKLAKQLINEDGEPVELEEQCWHLQDVGTTEMQLLCTGEPLDFGSQTGNGAEYVFKETKRGGITCKVCLSIIKAFKGVKL